MFKKSVVVGVSVSPEAGLEVAQVDYATGTVLKYGRKAVDYNIVRREISDLDLFKESLQDLLEEMAIPKGTELVLNMPTVAFKVTDYPAALEKLQMENAIEEELYDNVYLKNSEPCYSYAIVSSSLQFNKVVYTGLQKPTIIELVMFLKEIGYKIKTIDTSVNSVFRSLVYLDRVNTEPDTNWVLLTIENSCCRILSMQGRTYLDEFEEKISIGEVLSDAENYATVIAAIEPILKNLPSKYLCIVSKTNVISAEVVSNKIKYSAPIIYQEANCYLKEQLINVSSGVDAEYAKSISLDVIGAAIYPDYEATSNTNLNLYNGTLGDIYYADMPPTIGGVQLTNGLLIFAFAVIAGITMFLFLTILGWFAMQQANINNNIDDMQKEIESIDRFLAQHKDMSSEAFDEGDEIRLGLTHNKNVYSYYTIVGTEIPQKLWLTRLKLGDKTTIEGQADNLESIYSFFRSIKDYNPNSDIVLQKLGLASAAPKALFDLEAETDSVLTTRDADFYDFKISNEPEEQKAKAGQSDDGLPDELEDAN